MQLAMAANITRLVFPATSPEVSRSVAVALHPFHIRTELRRNRFTLSCIWVVVDLRHTELGSGAEHHARCHDIRVSVRSPRHFVDLDSTHDQHYPSSYMQPRSTLRIRDARPLVPRGSSRKRNEPAPPKHICISHAIGRLFRPFDLLRYHQAIPCPYRCVEQDKHTDSMPRRFKVMDDERLGDDLAAWACFRLDRLQPGLRMLHLYDANGVVTKGVLLVRIRKTVSMDRVGTW
jgi:hypothetical protein